MTEQLSLTHSQVTLVQVNNLGTKLFFVCILIPIIWEACINNTTEKRGYMVLTWPLSQDVTHLTGCVCVCVCLCTQSCPSLCSPVDCNSPGSVHGIFQARILEQVAVSYPRGPSPPRDQTCIACIFCISKWILYHWATREALLHAYPSLLSEKHI